MDQELNDYVEQIVPVIARSVDFIADEIKLRCYWVAAQDAALSLVFAEFLHNIFNAALLDIAQHDVTIVESSWGIWQRMQL